VFEDFRGRVVVEEGVNAVAHGVFDGVAAFDVGTVFVAAESVAESFEHADQFGFVRAQDVVGVGGGMHYRGGRYAETYCADPSSYYAA